MDERDLIDYAKYLADRGALTVGRLAMKAEWDAGLLGRAAFASAQEYHDHLAGLTHGARGYSRHRFNRIKDVHTALLKAHDQAADIAHHSSMSRRAQSA